MTNSSKLLQILILLIIAVGTGELCWKMTFFFLRNFDGFVIRDTEYYSSVILSLLGVNFSFLVVICDKFAAGKP